MTDLEMLQAVDPNLSYNPQQIVQQLSDSDPRLGALAQMWLKRREEASAESPDDNDQGDRKRRDFQRLNRTVQKMYDELERLRERNDVLAEALGACYLCWGVDISCPVCRGRGAPGYKEPDEALFLQYALPAARRLHAFAPGSRERSRASSRREEPLEPELVSKTVTASRNTTNSSKGEE